MERRHIKIVSGVGHPGPHHTSSMHMSSTAIVAVQRTLPPASTNSQEDFVVPGTSGFAVLPEIEDDVPGVVVVVEAAPEDTVEVVVALSSTGVVDEVCPLDEEEPSGGNVPITFTGPLPEAATFSAKAGPPLMPISAYEPR
mmetsp:Transcript_2184/g.3764  ORF Transcript_2184/g.3764 Transcript_2184/m.3764 type:complete len:141 (-) Transcript_2184:561-983(-)